MLTRLNISAYGPCETVVRIITPKNRSRSILTGVNKLADGR